MIYFDFLFLPLFTFCLWHPHKITSTWQKPINFLLSFTKNTNLHDSFSFSLLAVHWKHECQKKNWKKFFLKTKHTGNENVHWIQIDYHTSHACCKVLFYQYNLSGESIIIIINFPFDMHFSNKCAVDEFKLVIFQYWMCSLMLDKKHHKK